MNGHVLTVTLNPAVDKIIKISNFSLGEEDQRATGIILSAAGKGINVARALKNLGTKSVATGFLAGSTGNYIQEALRKENLQSAFLDVAGETRINLTIINSTTKQTTRLLEPGPKILLKDITRFKKQYQKLLKRCRWVIFSGSIAPGLPPNIYSILVTLAKRKGIKTTLDTSGQPFQLGLLAKPFMIKPNLEEAGGIVGYPLTSMAKIKKAMSYFHQRGVSLVVISMAAKGAVASDGKEILHAVGPQLQYTSNVGCGDSSVAGFVDAWGRLGNLKEAISWAVSCGTADLLTLQPGSFQKKIVRRVRRKVIVKRIG